MPLIGHEIPLYIQLKNSQPSHRDNLQVAAHHSDSLFDHFLLRHRKTALKNGLRHDRPRKGRRLTLTGLFGRKSSLPQQQQQPDVIQSTPQARLFGRSLPEVCSDESLPKPVMDFLRRLYVQGSTTPGIFRKPGNQRDLQDLKARLDAGEECNIDDITIHVASSALKSFLRDLPDCLLLSNLYCKWIDMVCIHDDSEKQEIAKRLVSLLPPTNHLLLRHLICVLHHISLHSEHNQMTSGNLAICLGPTFLRPEGSVDLTAQFGSVELVARVTEMLIDDAQVILGSDTLELFHDLDDEEPSGVVAELNFESEDSLGSHELISNKRDHLVQGTSLESLDSASFDETHSDNAVQSQMSVDSGLAISNPLLYDDPESPTATGSHTPASSFEGSRYAKRQPGTKKKHHTKSELSDISEARTDLDAEERPNSKMAGATNVRDRIHRFRASKPRSDETQNDSAGDNQESSEDETMSFARASISSSEYMGGDSIIGLNSEDGLSRDSLESEGKVTSEEVQRFAVDLIPETFRIERTEILGPTKTIIRLDSSSRADKTLSTAEGRSADGGFDGGLSSEWYFTGPETQVSARNLRSVPPKQQKPRSALLVNTSRSQATPSDGGVSSVGVKLTPSNSLRYDRPVKTPQDLRSVKQSSLDSVVTPSVASCPEMHALQEEGKRKSPHSSTSSSDTTAQFYPRLTGFQVLDNHPPPSSERSRLNRRSSSGLVSSDSFSRTDDRTRGPRERSVPPSQRHTEDVAVNVSDSCFRSSRGVQTDDCEIGPSIINPSRRVATVTVGADEADGVCLHKENPASAYKVGRRYKSDLDLTSNRGSWHQALADAYREDARRKVVSPVEQLRSSCESDGVKVSATTTTTGGLPLRNGERIASEGQQTHFPFQHHQPPRQLPVRKASLPREPAGNADQTRAPVTIEQRVKDRRAVTVVTIGDEKSILPSKFGNRLVHQPMSLNSDAAGGYQRLDNDRGNHSIPSEPSRRNLAERKSNGFENFHGTSSAQKAAATPRMLAVQPRSNFGYAPFNSSSPPCNSAVRQVVAPRRMDGQGHVFGGQQYDTPRDIDSHVYVPSSNINSPWKEDLRPDGRSRRGVGLQQRPSQNSFDSQRHPTTMRDTDSAWPCDDAGRRDEDARYVSAGVRNASQPPPFGTPRNTRTPLQQTNDHLDEPSGVTWSVNELKKVFDSSKKTNARFSPSQAAVGRKH